MNIIDIYNQDNSLRFSSTDIEKLKRLSRIIGISTFEAKKENFSSEYRIDIWIGNEDISCRFEEIIIGLSIKSDDIEKVLDLNKMAKDIIYFKSTKYGIKEIRESNMPDDIDINDMALVYNNLENCKVEFLKLMKYVLENTYEDIISYFREEYYIDLYDDNENEDFSYLFNYFPILND